LLVRGIRRVGCVLDLLTSCPRRAPTIVEVLGDLGVLTVEQVLIPDRRGRTAVADAMHESAQ
jgi:hypothetical protein